MPRVVRRLEERLRAVNKDNLEQAYEALKNYLMLYTPEQVRRRFVQGLGRRRLGRQPRRARLAPEQRAGARRSTSTRCSRGAPPPAAPMDKTLVASVRDMLVAYPLEYRVFSRLKRGAVGADYPDVHASPAPAGPNAAAASSSAPAASR